jgi:hypothetical protein
MQCPDRNGLALGFLAKSRSHYRDIVASHPEDQKDLQGWLNRIDGLQAEFCNGGNPPQQAATTAPEPSPRADDGIVITPNFGTSQTV